MTEAVVAAPLPPRPPPKIFKPKCPEIPVLDDYSGEAGDDFWDKFPKNMDMFGGSPYKLDADLLVKRAKEAGYANMALVDEIANDIRHGCDLKVNEVRCPVTRSYNAPSAAAEGKADPTLLNRFFVWKILRFVILLFVLAEI